MVYLYMTFMPSVFFVLCLQITNSSKDHFVFYSIKIVAEEACTTCAPMSIPFSSVVLLCWRARGAMYKHYTFTGISNRKLVYS